MSHESDANNSLNHSDLREHVKPAVCENVCSGPKNTTSEPGPIRPEATPTADAVTLARAIVAVNDLPLPPEMKATIIRQLAGL